MRKFLIFLNFHSMALFHDSFRIAINRPVDLALKNSIETSENWIRRNEILSTAQTVYEQG